MHYFIMVDRKDIKELRHALKMSQKDLAEKLGVSVRTIANYESGGVIPESKYKILASLSDPIAAKIHGVITGGMNIANTGSIGGSVSINAEDQIDKLHERIIELEKEVIRLNGGLSTKEETIKGLKDIIKVLEKTIKSSESMRDEFNKLLGSNKK